jgi:hypothetical protein
VVEVMVIFGVEVRVVVRVVGIVRDREGTVDAVVVVVVVIFIVRYKKGHCS